MAETWIVPVLLLALIEGMCIAPTGKQTVVIAELPRAAYEAAADNATSRGFALWDARACHVTMRAPATAADLCHELRHCREGQFHP